MTIEQFFERLPRDGWWIDNRGRIRLSGCGDCPIEAADRPGTGAFYLTSARKLGLADDLMDKIAASADNANKSTFFDPALRARLLAHCGLTEAK